MSIFFILFILVKYLYHKKDRYCFYNFLKDKYFRYIRYEYQLLS